MRLSSVQTGLILILLVAISFGTSQYIAPTGCTPFGVRLALGRNYYNPSHPQIVSIRFNTRLQCPKSYVNIEIDSSIRKTYCISRKISFSNYTSYSQQCSIEFLSKGDSYSYMAFGWTGNSSDPSIPFKSTSMKTKLIKNGQKVKMVVLADWGYLSQKANVYNNLDDSFEYILKQQQQPDVVYLGGDYAYDLSTNYGVSYQKFLIMLSQISSVWPCIFMTGNHEYYTKEDFMLFNTSFQLYDLTNKNVSILDLGSFSFVQLDPYGILFQNDTKKQLLARFKDTLDKASSSKPIVVTTHYPLACSGASTHCKNQRFLLEQFFNMMVDYNSVFYIGAHYHTYQRIYPYIKGGDFKLIPGPYSLTKNTKYLVSVVQGIAGNDKSIVQSYGKLSNYTAALSYNVTGYGIMDVNPQYLVYEHFKATDWMKPVDSVTIRYNELFTANLRQQ